MKGFAPALLAIALAAACTRNAPYRLGPRGAVTEARVGVSDLADSALRAPLESSGIEVHDDYRLHFLEFDDQGQLYSTAPFLRLVEALRADAQAPDRPRLRLVLFAHGWKNNARLCNDNVCCFRTFLSRLAADSRVAEQRSKGFLGPTRVIGVYVGWRGLSATVQPFKSLTFYSRKRAAANVGQGELVEVLSFLDRYQRNLNAETPNRCRLVILGHSFGGAMVFSAVANVLKSRVIEARVRTMLDREEAPIEGFGDLVVLVNPAFEASLYAPLHEVIGYFSEFSRRQSPLMVILASETDTSTRFYFKVGRWLETVFQRAGPRSPRDMLVRTVGNYEPFVTHEASVAPDAGLRRLKTLRGVVDNCECTLPMSEVDTAAVDRFLSILRLGPEEAAAALKPTLCPGSERLGVVSLDCVVNRPPGLPLWVVRAENDVVGGHSGFFTQPVTDIVRNLVARRVLEGSIAASSSPRP